MVVCGGHFSPYIATLQSLTIPTFRKYIMLIYSYLNILSCFFDFDFSKYKRIPLLLKVAHKHSKYVTWGKTIISKLILFLKWNNPTCPGHSRTQALDSDHCTAIRDVLNVSYRKSQHKGSSTPEPRLQHHLVS